jgi:hypothetical protein
MRLFGFKHLSDACEIAAADAKRTKVEQSTGAPAGMQTACCLCYKHSSRMPSRLFATNTAAACPPDAVRQAVLLYARMQCCGICCKSFDRPSAVVSAVDDAAQQKDTAAQAAAAPEPAQSLRPLMVQYYSKQPPAGWHQQQACLSMNLALQLTADVMRQGVLVSSLSSKSWLVSC